MRFLTEGAFQAFGIDSSALHWALDCSADVCAVQGTAQTDRQADGQTDRQTANMGRHRMHFNGIRPRSILLSDSLHAVGVGRIQTNGPGTMQTHQ